MKPKIIIERCEAFPHSRNYHISGVICTTKGAGFWMPIERIDNKNLKRVGEIGRQIVESFGNQSGIRFLYLEPSFLFIVKHKAFDWTAIENSILAFLAPAISSTRDMLEVVDEECCCQSGANCLLINQYHQSD